MEYDVALTDPLSKV